jgi:hypothetical protein
MFMQLRKGDSKNNTLANLVSQRPWKLLCVLSEVGVCVVYIDSCDVFMNIRWQELEELIKPLVGNFVLRTELSDIE